MNTRILIVDDDERVLFVLRRALETLEDRYLILTAQRGQLALERVEQASVDLVITDLIMPDMDGVELTERISSLAPETAVIWMTAYGCHKFKAEAERLGIYRCVDKPLEIYEIRQMAREALKGPSGQESNSGDIGGEAKLRVGVVHWAFPPVTGGVEMHLLTICPEMVRQGAEVSVLCGSVAGEPDTKEVEGVKVERRDGMVPAQIEETQEADECVYESSKRMFEAFLDDHGIDIVQAHNLHLDFHDLSRALGDACAERTIPRYLVIHNDVFIDRSVETTLRIVKDIGWDRLVPISQYIHDTMGAKLPDIPGDRWTVIMHGIDVETFRPVDDREKEALKREYGLEGRKVILHPGRFLPWKGILPAIKSMPRVREAVPDALMVMTGRARRIYKDQEELARYDERIEEYIQAHGLSDDVHIGDYTHEDIPRLTALSDVVIYTTIGDEPFGLVPVEGMACGVPVVVTNSGGLVESVVDGETGFVISKELDRLPGELAVRVIELLSDPVLARRLGENGRERVEEKFDKKRMAEDFIQLSEQLIREKAVE